VLVPVPLAFAKSLSPATLDAIKRLERKGCDGAQVAIWLDLLRDLHPATRPFESLDALDQLTRDIKALSERLSAFGVTQDGMWCFPPLVGPTQLGQVTAQLDHLHAILLNWRVHRGRGDLTTHARRAMLSAYVKTATRKWHDRLVADLLNAIEPDQMTSEGAVRKARGDHASLVKAFLAPVAR
jgi:hypothetical protein